MGVVVPKITGKHVEKLLHERGYGIIGTSVHLDEVGGGQPGQTRRERAGLIDDGGRPVGHGVVAHPV